MARPRLNRPVPIQHPSVDIVNGPSLGLVFTDLARFADDILQYSTQVCSGLQALRSRYWRDQLVRVERLTHQVQSVQADIADLRRSTFDGLRFVFKDKHPECIVLENFFNIISELNSVWKQLLEFTRDALHDEQAALQYEIFGGLADRLSAQITKSLDDWEEIPRFENSALCPCAARLLEGNDTGTVRPAQTSNHKERGIKRQKGGLFQDWQCDCSQVVRFYVSVKNTSLEAAKFPFRELDDSIKIRWRDIWAAKSHLASGGIAKYACLLCMGQGKDLVLHQSAFNTDTDLARHIGSQHDSTSLPKIFMQRLWITKRSDTGEGRSDVKFLKE